MSKCRDGNYMYPISCIKSFNTNLKSMSPEFLKSFLFEGGGGGGSKTGKSNISFSFRHWTLCAIPYRDLCLFARLAGFNQQHICKYLRYTSQIICIRQLSSLLSMKSACGPRSKSTMHPVVRCHFSRICNGCHVTYDLVVNNKK